MKELKYLKYFVIPFLSLAAFAICFFVAFVKSQLVYFLICAVLMTLFLVSFSIITKKTTTEYGYTLLQAYDFYKKCKKNGIFNAAGILDKKTLPSVRPIVEACDYAKNLDEKQIKKLYADGWNVVQYIKRLKGKF